MRRTIVLSALLAVTFVPRLTSQVDPADSLVAGSKVQVRVREGSRLVRYTGKWAGAGRDSLLVTVYGRQRAFAFGNVERLERAVGKKSAAVTGTIIGGIGGAALGAAVGALTYQECQPVGSFDCLLAASSAGQEAALGALVGGAVGVGIGVLIGAAAGQTQWRQVPLPLSAAGRVSWRPVVEPWGRGLRAGVRVGWKP